MAKTKTNKPSKASEETLAALHEMTAQYLMEKIRSGEATAADVAQAIKFLKDNHIEADLSVNTTLRDLKDELPQFDDDEQDYTE